MTCAHALIEYYVLINYTVCKKLLFLRHWRKIAISRSAMLVRRIFLSSELKCQAHEEQLGMSSFAGQLSRWLLFFRRIT